MQGVGPWRVLRATSTSYPDQCTFSRCYHRFYPVCFSSSGEEPKVFLRLLRCLPGCDKPSEFCVAVVGICRHGSQGLLATCESEDPIPKLETFGSRPRNMERTRQCIESRRIVGIGKKCAFRTKGFADCMGASNIIETNAIIQ
eukprot:4151945-Amphidinium_carterae.1